MHVLNDVIERHEMQMHEEMRMHENVFTRDKSFQKEFLLIWQQSLVHSVFDTPKIYYKDQIIIIRSLVCQSLLDKSVLTTHTAF